MISIIIPTFNEQESISTLIGYLKNNSPTGLEVIVVDGGSTDETVKIAEKAGAIVESSPKKGRSRQMNIGATISTNDILYFLHADTIPPSSFYYDIISAIEQGNASGCYRLSFDNNHPLLTFYSWFTKFNMDIFRFGDQSLFVSKRVFELVDGFDEELIVMEDQEIVKAIKKESNFLIFNKSVITSARKYEKIGIIKLQLIFTAIIAMYYAGIDQQKIARFYSRAIM
jgi:rSAM/selenodomain-associated transferase 2